MKRNKTPTNPEPSPAARDPFRRAIVAWERPKAPGFDVDLECGHRAWLNYEPVFGDSMVCPQCEREAGGAAAFNSECM